MEQLLETIKNIFDVLKTSESENKIEIMESCGKSCAMSHQLQEEALKIRSEVKDKNDLELLFTTYKEKAYNNLRLYKEGNSIYLEYHNCGCPLVKSNQIDDPLFCNCTRGYTKARFETLFGKPVHIELEKSILKGDEICKQKNKGLSKIKVRISRSGLKQETTS